MSLPANRHIPFAPVSLPIAVRVFSEKKDAEEESRSHRNFPCPDSMLVFDTETRTDATQSLIFGSYRFIEQGVCTDEGLFCADDITPEEYRVLEHYAATHRPDAVGVSSARIHLWTLRQFLEKLYRAAYKGRCLVVGFNLPFDLSRIARDFASARGRFAGGFSLGLWSYLDKMDGEQENRYRPRIGIKQIDSKRALKGFTSRNSPDKADLIPEGSETGEPEEGYKFRGHFLDLRTLAFALTDISYSLESACEAFGVEHGKQSVTRHGSVTEEYIDYNRRDVLATSELAFKLLEEYEKHPIPLQATKAYSPASIGKAYLRAMGIEPILKRQPDFPKKYLGFAQSAFYGGRTSAHIRKVTVPVVYVDFLSMYPTVNSLMDLWRFVTAGEIKVIDHCRADIEKFLRGLTANDLFKPTTWKQLTAFVKVIPDGDILPSRSKYSVVSNDWQVAVNHLHAGDHVANQALWFSLPDVVASVLLTGRIPKIIDAFRIEPRGNLQKLKSTRLRGEIEIDPTSQDFFKIVIEERKRLFSPAKISRSENSRRLDKALKVLANAASYGIYAEMIRQESDQRVEVVCHGIDERSFDCKVPHPEVPGEYCFSPLASLITGAARLMLALLEHCVSELGGTYTMEDTDSMAIVATEHGGLIRCPGGPHKGRNNCEAIKALSWEQVRQISERFSALNPYARDAVPGSILKIEDDNFDPKTGKQRQLYCLAISAKRYDLFLKDKRGVPVLLQTGVNSKDNHCSEHGLGHLLNPTDPNSEDRDWIAQAWLNIIRKSLGLRPRKLGFENRPAIGRVTVSSPNVMRAFANWNEGRKYSNQTKPFNFLLSCHINPLGHPIGSDPEQFHLIAPYEPDSSRWLKMDWVDQYSGKRYGITTNGYHGDRQTARVKTYEDILRAYEFHSETKCAAPDGSPCGKQTTGLLQRRHVRIDQIKYIGKESNSLEDVESGLIHTEKNVYTEYPDPKRDEWQTKILPALKAMPLNQLVKLSGMSRRAIVDLRAGRSRPHRRNLNRLASVMQFLFNR